MIVPGLEMARRLLLCRLRFQPGAQADQEVADAPAQLAPGAGTGGDSGVTQPLALSLVPQGGALVARQFDNKGQVVIEHRIASFRQQGAGFMFNRGFAILLLL
jgi:hypothetical protein